MWEGLVSWGNTSFAEAVTHYCFGHHFLMYLDYGVMRVWMYQMPEWHQGLETKLLQVILLFVLSCLPFTQCENMLLGINRPTNRAGETNEWASEMLSSFDVNYEERHYTKLTRFLFFCQLKLTASQHTFWGSWTIMATTHCMSAVHLFKWIFRSRLFLKNKNMLRKNRRNYFETWKYKLSCNIRGVVIRINANLCFYLYKCY